MQKQAHIDVICIYTNYDVFFVKYILIGEGHIEYNTSHISRNQYLPTTIDKFIILNYSKLSIQFNDTQMRYQSTVKQNI